MPQVKIRLDTIGSHLLYKTKSTAKGATIEDPDEFITVKLIVLVIVGPMLAYI